MGIARVIGRPRSTWPAARLLFPLHRQIGETKTLQRALGRPTPDHRDRRPGMVIWRSRTALNRVLGAALQPLRCVASEAVEGGRLAWAVSIRCGGCGSAAEVDGWDEMPAVVRVALVARVGLVRLRADVDVGDPPRVLLLAVFRRRGATVGEAATAYAALTGPGIVGTPAEMQLLADQLADAGVTVARTPHDDSM
jgi:hypothetical protein